MKIEIKGNDRYIKYLYKHLLIEHPSTKKRMKLIKKVKKKNGKSCKK